MSKVRSISELLAMAREGVEEGTGGFVSLDNQGRVTCAECGSRFIWDVAADIALCPSCGTPHPEDS